MEEIHLEDLKVKGILGIHPEERAHRQIIIINIWIYANLSKASKSDDLSDTVDYEDLKNQVFKLLKASSFFLIEKLAEAIAGICLSYSQVKEVKVKVQKPEALSCCKNVGITIFRKK